MEIIETQRTILRPFSLDDVDAVVSFLGDPEVMRFSLNGPYDRNQCEAFVKNNMEHHRLKGYALCAVVFKENGKVIGYCGFYDQVIDGMEEVEVGYRLHTDYWNQGIATEVAAAVIDYGFRQLKCQRLISIIEADNAGSIRVAEKNGMHHEKDAVFKDAVPVRIYSIHSNNLDALQ